jgi:hypothetical protein
MLDITVYLPDELGKWAKDAKLNLSGLLRERVEARKAAAELAKDADVFELYNADDDYTARLHGTLILESRHGASVFVGADESLYVYDDRRQQLWEDVPVDELRGLLPDRDEYMRAVAALGEEAVVDVGMAP